MADAPDWTVTLLESNIARGGICIAQGCTGNTRFAGDFISAAIDSHEGAHLAWMRQHGAGADIRYAHLSR